MALALVGEGLDLDGRWNRWGKLIRGPEDIDLNGRGGYALRGPFAAWGTMVAIETGAYLVFAAETGSRKRHEYSYRCLDDHGRAITVDWDAISSLPEVWQAAAHNAPAYAIAADLWLRFQTQSLGEMHPAAAVQSPLESIWRSIQELSPQERADLFGRMLREF